MEKPLAVKDEPSGVPQDGPTEFPQAENSPFQGVLGYNLDSINNFTRLNGSVATLIPKLIHNFRNTDKSLLKQDYTIVDAGNCPELTSHCYFSTKNATEIE